MRIVLTFVLNAGLSLALGLALAGLLGPEDYGRFAAGSTVAVVLGMSLFDWLRLSATRFYGEGTRQGEPSIRATLNVAYAALAGLLVAGTGVAVALRFDFGLGPALLAAAALGGLAIGGFDFYSALARARFLDRSYAVLVISKNVLAFGLGVGASILTGDPAIALAATALGALLALTPVHGALRDATAARRHATLARLRGYAVYGFPIVAANIVFQIVLLANRSAAASEFGYADAGRLSLATDLGLRLFLAVGAAVDVFVFQLAVRADAVNGRPAAEAQLRLNVVIVAAVLTLLAVGYAMAMPAFTAVLVPERYRSAFGGLSLTLLPGLFTFCIAQFALSPMFQVAGRTGFVFLGGLSTLALDAIGLALLPHEAGVGGIAILHSASLALGAFAIAAMALRSKANRPPLGDIGRILIAALLAALAMWPARALTPAWVSLAAGTAFGTAAYALTLIALDLAGVRDTIQARFRIGRYAKMMTAPS